VVDSAQTLTGAEAVVRSLELHGVELVFGIPGIHTLPIYDHLASSPIRHVSPRHEEGAGFAADGYARTTGRPGVCIVITGPGLTNLATAAAQAYSDSVPVLIISTALPRELVGRASGYLHEAKDQQRALDGLVAWSHTAKSPADAVDALDRAFSGFAEGRPRPVHVAIPLDVLEMTEAVDPGPRRRPRGVVLDTQAATAAARLLAEARHPVIIAGGGARGAPAEVRRLAERTGAPVISTFNGKGVLPEDHPLSLGSSLYLPAARSFVNGCDVVVAVGTELGQADMWLGGLDLTGRLVRIDIDPTQLDKNYPADLGILGDAGEALNLVVEALGGRIAESGMPERLAAAREAIARDAATDGREWIPLMRTLRQELAPDAIVAGDNNQACLYGLLSFPVRQPASFLFPSGYATLGYGLPAAIGAKLAHPDRQVVALMGDGGLMFTVGELATAAELRLPLPVIVVNNGGYGEIRREMDRRGSPRLGVDLLNPDFPALGRAFGGRGVPVDDLAELPSALTGAFAFEGPTVIELRRW
jgi:thiamine pyrophosphate-dependent acetolactate synthase large subunit-like protein